MTFVIDPIDINGTGNGDVCIRTDKGTLAALIYSASDRTLDRATVIARALNEAFAPGHTDLMIAPEGLDEWLERNPLPLDIHTDQTSPITLGPEAFFGGADKNAA